MGQALRGTGRIRQARQRRIETETERGEREREREGEGERMLKACIKSRFHPCTPALLGHPRLG